MTTYFIIFSVMCFSYMAILCIQFLFDVDSIENDLRRKIESIEFDIAEIIKIINHGK